MNYLAHAYLSFDMPGLLIGNLISDFVKGKKQFNYPPDIRQGIMLHRAIDEFTDQHPSTKAAKAVFSAHYRLYAGAFIDVVYDHFLATDETIFSPESLLQFSEHVYRQAEQFAPQLPDGFRAMLPYMKAQNWLYNYRYRWGIERSFGGLVRRAAYLSESAIAFELFNQHYGELRVHFKAFFPQLQSFAREYLLSSGQNI